MADTLRQLTDTELTALALLDAAQDPFTGMTTAAKETGLTHEEIREANSLRAAQRRVNGGVTLTPAGAPDVDPEPVAHGAGAADEEVPVFDLVHDAPDPKPEAPVAELLERAAQIGSARARHLAANIARDTKDLRETLVEDERTYAARLRVEQLRAQALRVRGALVAAEAALREASGLSKTTTAAKTAARSAKKKSPARNRAAAANRSHYSAATRDWARENGYEVSERGRLSDEIIRAYKSAQESAQAPGSAES